MHVKFINWYSPWFTEVEECMFCCIIYIILFVKVIIRRIQSSSPLLFFFQKFVCSTISVFCVQFWFLYTRLVSYLVCVYETMSQVYVPTICKILSLYKIVDNLHNLHYKDSFKLLLEYNKYLIQTFFTVK